MYFGHVSGILEREERNWRFLLVPPVFSLGFFWAAPRINLFRLSLSLLYAQAEPARKVFWDAEQLERELTTLICSGIASEPLIP